MRPWPAWRSPRWRDVEYWVLDLEPGGLDASRDSIMSLGMLPIRDGVILFGESYYTTIAAEGAVKTDSLLVHHILPSDLIGAPCLDEVLEEVDRRLQDAVLIVHHAPLDLRFLRTAYRKCGRGRLRVRVIDTVKLLIQLNRRLSVGNVPLRLGEARAHLGFPPHEEHHALSDAVATAELFLLLAHRLGARTLRHLLGWVGLGR